MNIRTIRGSQRCFLSRHCFTKSSNLSCRTAGISVRSVKTVILRDNIQLDSEILSRTFECLFAISIFSSETANQLKNSVVLPPPRSCTFQSQLCSFDRDCIDVEYHSTFCAARRFSLYKKTDPLGPPRKIGNVSGETLKK